MRRVVDELLRLRLRLQARDVANNPPATAENAGHRQREQELLDVARREQQRMGSAVHDGLGQELTGAALMLQACLRDLRASNSPQASAHHLLRIAQEAMNNSLKHSSATVVVLELGPTADGIYLCVRDNGRGFPDAIAGGDGLGMRLTQYRAHQLGAELRTHSAPNQGVTITCRCPVHSLQPRTDFSGSRDVR